MNRRDFLQLIGLGAAAVPVAAVYKHAKHLDLITESIHTIHPHAKRQISLDQPHRIYPHSNLQTGWVFDRMIPMDVDGRRYWMVAYRPAENPAGQLPWEL